MIVQIKHNGLPLPQIHHAGQVFIPAPTSGEYSIELYNDSSARKEVVISVDGLSIMDGQPASMNRSGYVLLPWQTCEIPGWRRSSAEVAKFVFGSTATSYSVLSGQGDSNLGVIGVAVYAEVRSVTRREKAQFLGSLPVKSIGRGGMRSASSRGMGMMGSSHSTAVPTSSTIGGSWSGTTGSSDVGTGYGQAAAFDTISTVFNRKQSPEIVFTFRYASNEVLAAWGVPVLVPAQTPNPFPVDGCAPPPGWVR